MLHIKQNSHFYTVTLAYKTSLILQAQGVRRAWVGDYDTLPQFISIAKDKQTSCATSLQAKWENNYIHITTFWFEFCKVNANSSGYRYPSQRLHVSSPQAGLSEHQRTQDTLRTDEPSP